MKASLLLLSFTASQALASAIVRRDTTCTELDARSNNGDRKIAIAIDSSRSMTSSDPDDLRLSAGRTISGWLIAKSEFTGGNRMILLLLSTWALLLWIILWATQLVRVLYLRALGQVEGRTLRAESRYLGCWLGNSRGVEVEQRATGLVS